MSGNNTISRYLEIMKSLYTLILVFISLSTSAQIKGYGHFGRTFFTKGDISGRIMSIGISKSNKINSLGYYCIPPGCSNTKLGIFSFLRSSPY